MIKEVKKNRPKKKTLLQNILEYAKTALFAFLIALGVTVLLTLNARQEMLKNLAVENERHFLIDEKVAEQILKQKNLSLALASKNYTICMQIGNLYETTKDYKKAQEAYEAAITKINGIKYYPYQKLVTVLAAQEKFKEAEQVIQSIDDIQDKNLIKFKTRSYIILGDKYYSIGKFLSAAKNYENAKYYYDRFSKKDAEIEKAIILRLANSYIEGADIIVKNGYNSDAVRLLKKAEKYDPDNYKIKYKLAIIYSDLDPETSVKYFEPLLEQMPQDIDYNVYNVALIKSANIADLEGRSTDAKYYRYKIHSKDLFIQQKVVYKDDVEIQLMDFSVKKFLFKYHLKGHYIIKNVSSSDINNLYADFVLKQKDKVREIVTVKCASKQIPLLSNNGETAPIEVKFGKNILTKKELENYTIEVYLYKAKKYKTLTAVYSVNEK